MPRDLMLPQKPDHKSPPLKRTGRVRLAGEAAHNPPGRLGQVASCAAALISLVVFFRFALTTDFNQLFGDKYDGVIETAILEHWYNVFSGASTWSKTFYFYPIRAALGYNDGYLIYGILYAALKPLAADPFVASELVDILIKSAGFAGFYLFARRTFLIPRRWAALGAAVFTVANGSYMQGRHVQLFAVAFAPITASLVHEAATATVQSRRRASAAWGAAASVMLAAWLLTAFYMAWFFAFFCAIWILVLGGTAGAPRLAAVLSAVCRGWQPLALGALALGISLLPFFELYMPTARETGMHVFQDAFKYLDGPIDVLQLGGRSLFYDRVQNWMMPWFSTGSEQATGFTPLLLLSFLVAAAWSLQHYDNASTKLPASMAISTLIFWLLTLHVGRFSPWELVYHFVPGAKAIRVVARAQIFMIWPVVTVAMAGFATAERSLHGHPLKRAGLGLIGLLLFAEQYNTQRVPALNRQEEMAWLRTIPSPPATCGSFFVSTPRPPSRSDLPVVNGMVGANIDAMLLAEISRLPTVNGFASFLPVGWNLLWVDAPDYTARVRSYAVDHELRATLCGVDLATGRWTVAPLAR